MSDPTVFDNPEKKEENKEISPYETILQEIKNDRGEQKYKNLEEALKALKNSQEYIPTLHSQIDALKTEKEMLEKQHEKFLGIEDKLELLLRKEEDNSNPPKVEPKVEDNNDKIDINQIDSLIQQRLLQKEIERVEANNLKTVSDTISSVYGNEKAFEVIAKRATELGISVEDMKRLAAKSPDAVFSMFGINKNSMSPNVSSTVNSASLRPVENSEIRKNDKSLSGLTTNEIVEEFKRSKTMVEQIRNNQMDINDLSDPKVYFKYFGKG